MILRCNAAMMQISPDKMTSTEPQRKEPVFDRSDRPCLRLSDLKRYVTSLLMKTAQNAFKSVGNMTCLFASPICANHTKSLVI